MFSIDKFTRIRAGSRLFVGSSRKTRIVTASALFLAVCAFGAAGVAPMAPDASDLPVKSITEELALPQLAEQVAALANHDQHYVSEEKVRAGDTLPLHTLLSGCGAFACRTIKYKRRLFFPFG